MMRTPRFRNISMRSGSSSRNAVYWKPGIMPTRLSLLGAGDIRVLANNSQRVRILLHQGLEPCQVLDRALEIPVRERAINGGNPRLPNHGHGLGAGRFLLIEKRAAQGIHDNGPFVEFSDIGRSTGALAREQTGSEQRCGRELENRNGEFSAIQEAVPQGSYRRRDYTTPLRDIPGMRIGTSLRGAETPARG